MGVNLGLIKQSRERKNSQRGGGGEGELNNRRIILEKLFLVLEGISSWNLTRIKET